MSRRDSFSGFHPLVNFVYFALVIGFTMFLAHPACLAVSLVCGVCYGVSLNGAGALRAQASFALPMAGLTALINLLFNHRGSTVLARLPGGSPLTLESAAWALAAAAMVWAAAAWFSCCNRVMTPDKFLYLFGRAIPSTALALTMTMGLAPRFRRRLQAVVQAQRCVGRSVTEGPLKERLQNAVTILSAMLTWSLESSVTTADSMKSRGYGLPGRTSFSLYRFTARDGAALAWLAFCGLIVLWGRIGGGLTWAYFPAVSLGRATPAAAAALTAYLALCLTPLILQGKEALAWRCSTCAM